ncbi:MAG: glycosyltransferase family 2 protein [Bacteroidetes bacterium]|nr:glycosyltransferase family 2 protein [Bacteroidota bacterium]
MKKLAVLLPTFNAAPFIKDSVNSILNQTYKDFDLFIYDDCSTDKTAEIILEFEDSRLFYRKNEINYGVAKTLNRGLDELLPKYEYVARMDADDWAFPMRFEKQLDFLEKNQGYTMCGTQGYWLKDMKQNPESGWEYPVNYEYLKCYLLFGASFGHSSVVLRSVHLLNQNLKYNEEYITSQDFDLWTRMASKGLKFANLPNFLMKYRVLENSNHRSLQNRNKLIKINTTIISGYWSQFEIKMTPQQVYEYYYKSNELSKAEFLHKLINLIEVFNKLFKNTSTNFTEEDKKKYSYLLSRRILKYWKQSNTSRRNLKIWYLLISKVQFISKWRLVKSLIK